ncbi:MAG: DUF4162 domain-containing protein, partial [Anaerolineales bacterium]|nr:DUF4162 domain-containing protein [Anaerolineales bacterium]
VDVQGKHALWDHIKAQQAQGKTFIISTNDMAEADYLCDRLLIIDRGTAVVTDTPENLKAALGRDIVTLRTTPIITDPLKLFAGLGVETADTPEPDLLRLELRHAEQIVGELVNRVAQAHQLESVRIARPTLDDVFLHHTGRALRE